MRSTFKLLALAVSLALAAGSMIASAVTVDGHLDPEYGPALATQVNGFNDVADTRGSAPYRNFSALDVLHAYVSSDSVLHVFVGGVLKDWIGAVGPSFDYDDLYLFIDDRPGGQGSLMSDGTGLYGFPSQAGLRFDTGFVPDFGLVAHAPVWFGSGASEFFIEGYRYTLDAQSSTGEFLGSGSGAAPGFLTGGSNPYDVRLAIDNSATPGVPGSCVAGSGAGTTSGVEWSIPMAAIGTPSSCFRIMVYASFYYRSVTNQVLPPVPVGTCALGVAANVDFSAIAGDQFVTICPTLVPTRGTTWGALKTRYR